MPRPTSHVLVSVPVAELRRGPSHSSELLTQALMGEALDVTGRNADGKWLRVIRWDGYRGWVRGWSVLPLSAAASLVWQKGELMQVASRTMPVFAGVGRSSPVVCELAFGTRIQAQAGRGAWSRVVLPGQRPGWVRRSQLSGVPAGAPSAGSVVSLARLFAGAPYLWGGVTPWGCDCSGFVQSAFRSCGVDLPRDARQQLRALRASLLDHAAAQFKPGDLLFFGARGRPVSHVAISTGGTAFVHAYGYVREGNLEEGSPGFLPELPPIFRAAARPLGGQKKG